MVKAILNNSTRPTGHLNSICYLQVRKAEIGNDFGLANAVVYATHGMDTLYVLDVYYADNMHFGPNLVGVKKFDENEVIFTHLSNKEGHTWSMTFKKA